MVNIAPMMNLYPVSEDRVRVEATIPCAHHTPFIITIELPEAKLDEINQEALQRVIQSLSHQVQVFACADEVARQTNRAVSTNRLRVGGFMSCCESTLSRLAKSLPRRGRLEYVAAGSIAQHSK